MPRIASKIGATLKGKNLLPEEQILWEQILSFKSSHYGKKANFLCQCHFTINNFITHDTHMRTVRNEHYAYGICIVNQSKRTQPSDDPKAKYL